MTRRRRLLAVLGSLAGLSLSGCSEGAGDTPTGGTATGTPTATTGTTTTPAPTATLAERRSVARRLTERLAAGEYEAVSGAFLASRREDFTPAVLRRAWVFHTSGKGEFQGIASVEPTDREGRTVVVVTARHEAGRVRAIWFFAEGEPSAVEFRQADAEYDPPVYADGEAFAERQVTLPTPACDLGGTLSEPTGDSAAGVVLVHGTGPQGRDLTVGPNRPFQDLAWGLATRGIAVLRYDKRTLACDVTRTDRVTIDDVTTDDAVTAVERLRRVDGVDRVVVVGHSQGGMMAPRIVDRSTATGMALLSAPAGPLWELVPRQVRYLAELDGEVTADERDRIDRVERAAERIASGEFDPGETLLGASTTYWESLRTYDQTTAAADLGVPAFVGHGGRDYQVPPSAVEEWRRALGDRITARTYPDLNHLLLPGIGPSSPYNYANPGSVDRAVVEDLAAFVDRV